MSAIGVSFTALSHLGAVKESAIRQGKSCHAPTSGPQIGGCVVDLDFNGRCLIWGKPDQIQAKYPNMVLFHGGRPKGADLIAAKWAGASKVTQVAFKPDWTKHAKAAL